MLEAPTTIIRSRGALNSHAPDRSFGFSIPGQQLGHQDQQTTQAALEQRQLLQRSSLPSAAGIIFQGISRALDQIAQKSPTPFVVTLQVRWHSSVAITVQGDTPPPALPQEFRNFEIPRFAQSKTIHLMLRPALPPRGCSVMEFDLGAFLFSRGRGLEDLEPNWYAIKRSATHEEVTDWFSDWLVK